VLIEKVIASFRRAHEARQLRKTRIPELRWRDAVSQVEVLQHLSPAERHRLRELASEFLRMKAFSGAGGLELTADMRTLIAAQACLLILELDLSYFDGWHEIIVYPDPFVVRRDETDAAGLVHAAQHVLGGEAWSQGPVVLSWSDARPGAHPHGEGSNVILHEFAHKLDMLNGAANGMPPLHKDMLRETWTRVFQHTYDDLYHTLERHHHSPIDPYAVESPAEFFAVTTEYFFESPQRLLHLYPDLYDQLRQFYRQDPLQRETNQY
jgi:Mlc titration factor MtfA (ptsG expression regulator)